MGWIVTDECLPDFEREVLVCIDSKYGMCVAVAVLDKPLVGAPNNWREWSPGDAVVGGDSELRSGKVTHWMLLPDLPS